MKSPASSPQSKRATNLSIRNELLDRAKMLNINLSATVEALLEQYLADHSRKSWLEKNRKALSDYNRQVEKYGVFSQGRRRF